jgi:Zn-finger nucleic acid-binding protein
VPHGRPASHDDEERAVECPKCGEAMRSYERSGVTVDQCTGCRGVFLDRGELERLMDAETGFYKADRDGDRDRDRDDRDRDRYKDDRDRYQPKKKKTSFLSELFD